MSNISFSEEIKQIQENLKKQEEIIKKYYDNTQKNKTSKVKHSDVYFECSFGNNQ